MKSFFNVRFASLCTLLMFLNIFLIPQKTSAQEWVEHKRFKVNGSDFIIDNLNNVYSYNERIIEKYNALGTLLFSYSSTATSSISKIDVLNPLRILVFYKDISRVIYLDNTLSETGISINLSDKELQQTSLVCNSANKGFWLFNPQNIELIHLDNNLEMLSKTGNLSVLLQLEIMPYQLFEFNNFVHLCIENSILQFDNFGTYMKSIPIHCNNCLVDEMAIYNSTDTILQSYNFKFKQLKETYVKHTGLTRLYNGKFLYELQKNGELVIYKQKN